MSKYLITASYSAEGIKGVREAGGTARLDRAAYQVMALVAPFMRGDARMLIDRLGSEYL